MAKRRRRPGLTGTHLEEPILRPAPLKTDADGNPLNPPNFQDAPIRLNPGETIDDKFQTIPAATHPSITPGPVTHRPGQQPIFGGNGSNVVGPQSSPFGPPDRPTRGVPATAPRGTESFETDVSNRFLSGARPAPGTEAIMDRFFSSDLPTQVAIANDPNTPPAARRAMRDALMNRQGRSQEPQRFTPDPDALETAEARLREVQGTGRYGTREARLRPQFEARRQRVIELNKRRAERGLPPMRMPPTFDEHQADLEARREERRSANEQARLEGINRQRARQGRGPLTPGLTPSQQISNDARERIGREPLFTPGQPSTGPDGIRQYQQPIEDIDPTTVPKGDVIQDENGDKHIRMQNGEFAPAIRNPDHDPADPDSDPWMAIPQNKSQQMEVLFGLSAPPKLPTGMVYPPEVSQQMGELQSEANAVLKSFNEGKIDFQDAHREISRLKQQMMVLGHGSQRIDVQRQDRLAADAADAQKKTEETRTKEAVKRAEKKIADDVSEGKESDLRAPTQKEIEAELNIISETEQNVRAAIQAEQEREQQAVPNATGQASPRAASDPNFPRESNVGQVHRGEQVGERQTAETSGSLPFNERLELSINFTATGESKGGTIRDPESGHEWQARQVKIQGQVGWVPIVSTSEDWDAVPAGDAYYHQQFQVVLGKKTDLAVAVPDAELEPAAPVPGS